MPRKLTYQGQALLLGGLIIAGWWIVPFTFKSFARVTFFEFQAPSWVALSYLRDLEDYWSDRTHSKTELIEAGIDLSRLAAAYELRNQQATNWKSEILRLEQLLDLPRLPTHRYEVARVVQRDLTAWWQRMVIRKGRRDGVREGQAVVYADGVAGRVTEVHTYTAVVELVTSPRFRVAAHFEGDLRPMQFNGGQNQALHAPRASISNVPPDITIENGKRRRVTSSRLGGVFPDGLTLGHVEYVQPEPDGLFQTAEVIINPSLVSVREVAVLIPLGEPEEDAEEER